MKRTFLAAAAMLVVAAAAHADSAPKKGMGGIGFRAPITPMSFALVEPQAAPTIGIRNWFNSVLGFDLALGAYQAEIKPLPEKFTGYTIDVGVPLAVKRPSEKVTLIIRPGFQWGQIEDVDETPPPITIDWDLYGATLEMEAEWFVADKLSLSASYGAGYFKLKDNGDPETTRTFVGTLGTNFTELGFHVYLW
jgi:outer membrane protein with beta-barrel domain